MPYTDVKIELACSKNHPVHMNMHVDDVFLSFKTHADGILDCGA